MGTVDEEQWALFMVDTHYPANEISSWIQPWLEDTRAVQRMAETNSNFYGLRRLQHLRGFLEEVANGG